MDATVCLDFVHKYLALKPDINRCSCSNCDRLGFYAEIQINFLGQTISVLGSVYENIGYIQYTNGPGK